MCFRVGISVLGQYIVAHERPFRHKNELSYQLSVSNLEAHLILLPVISCVTGNKNYYKVRYSYSDNAGSEQIEVRQCLLSFGAESLFFQVVI
jgi:hypothetical protein